MNYIYEPATEEIIREMWYGFNENNFDDTGLKWTIEGEPYLTKVGKKFGTSAICFNGESYLKSARTIPFNSAESATVGAAITLFVTPAKVQTSTIFEMSNGSAKYGIDINSSGKLIARAPDYTITGTTVTAGQTYCATFFIVKSSSYNEYSWYHFYINGAKQANNKYTYHYSGNFTLSIGAKVDGSNKFVGMVDEFRIAKVAGKQGDGITASANIQPTSPFTADSNTLSLLHFNL